MKKNYYEILELNSGATQDEIKRAFRTLSLKYHPDKNPEGAERFKEINEAYQVLSDTTKRKQYDFQSSGNSFSGNSFSGNWGDMFSSTDGFFSGFSFTEDVFERREVVIPTLEIECYCSIKDAVFGAKKTVKYKRKTWCSNCADTHIRCNNCGGSGVIVEVRGNGYFRVEQRQPCNTCKGSGSIKRRTETCPPECKEGFILEDFTIIVDIPKGIDKTTLLRIRYGGHESPTKKGQRGDVIIKVIEQPEENHERVGNDIVITDEVRYIDLVTGTSKNISMFNDKDYQYTYYIEKWFDTDTLIRLCDGPFAGGKTYIRVKLHIPKQDLTSDQLESLKRICED
jgi:molecular chaperone DnaJ